MITYHHRHHHLFRPRYKLQIILLRLERDRQNEHGDVLWKKNAKWSLREDGQILCAQKHRRRSGWTSGGRMASAEGGSVPSGVGSGDGYLLSSRLEGLGEHHELPQRGRKRILKYFEGHKTLLIVPTWQNLWRGGQFALTSPTPNSRGTCPPRPPWSTPMRRSLWQKLTWRDLDVSRL